MLGDDGESSENRGWYPNGSPLGGVTLGFLVLVGYPVSSRILGGG
jgi:hypothetical protein